MNAMRQSSQKKNDKIIEPLYCLFPSHIHTHWEQILDSSELGQSLFMILNQQNIESKMMSLINCDFRALLSFSKISIQWIHFYKFSFHKFQKKRRLKKTILIRISTVKRPQALCAQNDTMRPRNKEYMHSCTSQTIHLYWFGVPKRVL